MLQIKTVTVNGQASPMGIDEQPSLSWILTSDQPNTLQTAYRITVSCGYDSGKIESSDNQNIRLSIEFAPRTDYKVVVTVWDNHGGCAEAETSFETGLLGHFDAEWISDYRCGRQKFCPIFRKEFKTEKKIVSARLYASARGVYKAQINGKKISDIYMAPGWTNYNQRIEYQSYDITDLLTEENILDITLGKGWYRGEIGYFHVSNYYGVHGSIIAQLHIRYCDGTEDTILTDDTWQWKASNIVDSEIYNGETVFFCDSAGGYSLPSNWSRVRVLPERKDVLVSQECPPVRPVQELQAIELIHTPAGETVIDFGQILTGFVRAKITAPKGTVVTIRHAEVLDEKGNFYTVNLRDALAADTIHCSGGQDLFEPSFTFHGFRYIKVEGLGEDLDISNFTAVVCHSDIRQTGHFACSHPGLNQLQHNILWGQKGNFFDIPTDCPQRDERLGWTGDAQVFFNTAAFNMDVKLFFQKWMRDVRSQQDMFLGCPTTIPDVVGERGTTGWGDCCCIIPWNLYQAYGDKALLKEQYPTMRHWLRFIASVCNEKGLWQQGFQHGDWLALDEPNELDDRIGGTDVYFIANAFYANSLKLTMQAAQVLGYDDDAAALNETYQAVVRAWRKEYVRADGELTCDTQTAAILALHFDLLEEAQRHQAAQMLVRNLHKHDDHLTTGFLGTPYLCHVLTENGYHELAGKVLLQEDFPSWLFAVNMGATTVWERWNSMNPDRTISDTGMTSFNHYAYGCIGEWMYRKLCGIRTAKPGYRESILAPKPIAPLSWAEASLETPYGQLSCRWEKKDGELHIAVTVPCNTTATLILPYSGKEIPLGSGSYEFTDCMR